MLEGAWLGEAAADDDVALVDVALLACAAVAVVVDGAAATLEVVLVGGEAESDDPLEQAVRASRGRAASAASFFMS